MTSSSSSTTLYPKSSSCSNLKSSLVSKSECIPVNLFLPKFSLLSFGICPSALNKMAGSTRVDAEESWLELRLSSSSVFRQYKSSGSVTNPLPCRSSDFSRATVYSERSDDALTELYDRFTFSKRGKSSDNNKGMLSMPLYCRFTSARDFRFFSYSRRTWLSERSIEFRFWK